uniref:Extensin-like n=1 Tax=Cicer arietinum TaxID=3827 RepID=A0A1S2Z5J7_CICAR|nr:extensin-like [Cicer arietinum]
MARTKQSARKNASPFTPYSLSPSSDSVERSPSPPPRPTPPHTPSDSPSSNNNQEILNPNPLYTLLPPLYTRPTPNLAQVPPHLRSQTTPPQRSMRVQSGIGTSKPLNPKPYYFIISDSETDDSSDSCPPSSEKAPTKTKPSATTPTHTQPSTSARTPTNIEPTTPSKSTFSSEPSQSTPSNQKRRLINEIVSPFTKQNEPPPQSKPQTKPMKTKSAMTIAQYLDRKIIPNPQRRKTHAPKQNLKHYQPTSPEHSPQCSPPQPQEQERSPVQTPLSPPTQERSPNQELSPAHTVPPPESPPHPQPSPSTHAKRSPTPKPSSTSTSSESEPSPPSKKSKQNTLALISPNKSKLFENKWAQRLVGIGRVFVFDSLIIEGNAVQHHTDALGWTSFLQTSECYYPDVVRAFYCNAKTFADKL